MDSDDFRFSISAEKYLDKHFILTYLEDSVAQLLEHKEDNPKVNVTKFFSDYFISVKEGNHVLFREFAFVKCTPHNRVSFVRTFWKCFRNIGRKGDLLSVREYHSLLCLLCPDFPFPPVQKTARIILMEDAMDCLISFPDFLYAFQVQFSYDEFLSRCAEVYKELLHNPQSVHDTVVVPTSEEAAAPVHQNSKEAASSSDGVDAMQYFRALIPVCEKLDLNAPALPVLREILSATDRVTFYGFLMAMAKSETLNTRIGMLPNKSELLDLSDQELTSSTASLLCGNLARIPSDPPLPNSSRFRSSIIQARPLSALSGTNSTSSLLSPGGVAGVDAHTTLSSDSVSRTGKHSLSRSQLSSSETTEPPPVRTKPPSSGGGGGGHGATRPKHGTHTAARSAARKAGIVVTTIRGAPTTNVDDDDDDDDDDDSTDSGSSTN